VTLDAIDGGIPLRRKFEPSPPGRVAIQEAPAFPISGGHAMSYDWDLIERLLLRAQECADQPYKARECGEEVAEQHRLQGEPVEGSVDHLKKIAGDLEGDLFANGYIQERPREHGGTGNNFELTERGTELLTLISRSFPDHLVFRQLLDEQGEAALLPETFDQLAERATRDRVDDKPER